MQCAWAIGCATSAALGRGSANAHDVEECARERQRVYASA
jgi:hypothetical protein